MSLMHSVQNPAVRHATLAAHSFGDVLSPGRRTNLSFLTWLAGGELGELLVKEEAELRKPEIFNTFPSG